MKRTVLMIIPALICRLVFIGCFDKAEPKRYGIESVVLKKKHTSMNRELSEETIYIADYGRTESRETVIEHEELTNTMFGIIKDSFLYIISDIRSKTDTSIIKKAIKINRLKMIPEWRDVNFLDLTNELKKKYQIEEKGIEQFLGKECKRYDLSNPSQVDGMKVTVLVWQGLLLKTTTTYFGNTTVEEVTEIQEDAVIAREKFELPEGVHFEEWR